MEKVIPIPEAAARYHCSQKTVRRAIQSGKLTAYKPGREILVDIESGDAWFKSTQIKPRPKRGRPRK